MFIHRYRTTNQMVWGKQTSNTIYICVLLKSDGGHDYKWN